MACIERIYSVSAVIGSGKCNGKCPACAGAYLRPQARAHKYDAEKYWKNYKAAIRLSARYGGWSLSLTSSGEPTCDPDDVTEALRAYQECARGGAYFPNVNLFTNGILLGDDDFCARYLPIWKEAGLTNIAVSIYSEDHAKQSATYGLSTDEYPNYQKIFDNIRSYGIGVRCTVLLMRGLVEDAETYRRAVTTLIDTYDIDNITSWPIGNPNGSRCAYTPSHLGLAGIRFWLWKNGVLCHGHSWGGGVYDYNGNILRYTDYVTKHNRRKNFVRQLVVFQDGTVAYSWVREGALCLK